MYNKVILVGNLARDIELKYTPSGTAIASFGFATNRVYLDATTKEKKQEVMFIDVNIFGKMAETANQYLKKGSQALIEGRLVLDQWTDQSGQKRSKHKIVAEQVKFLGGGNHSNSNGSNNSYANNGGQYRNSESNSASQTAPTSQQQQNVPTIDVDEEDIPF